MMRPSPNYFGHLLPLLANTGMKCDDCNACSGSFPCLRAYLHLERRLRAYILSTFLPSLLVVLLSWVSFWIDLESVPARISLGILTMLTITTQSSVHLRGMDLSVVVKDQDWNIGPRGLSTFLEDNNSGTGVTLMRGTRGAPAWNASCVVHESNRRVDGYMSSVRVWFIYRVLGRQRAGSS